MVHIGTGSIDMTEKAFGTVAGILSAMPAQQRWDDGVAMGYAIALNGVEDKAGIEAVIELLKTEVFRPSPAAILRKVRGLRCGETSVQQMFNRICRYLADVHPSKRHTEESQWLLEGELHPFDIVAIKHIGGWGEAGRMNREQLLKSLDGWTENASDNVQALVQTSTKAITQ